MSDEPTGHGGKRGKKQVSASEIAKKDKPPTNAAKGRANRSNKANKAKKRDPFNWMTILTAGLVAVGAGGLGAAIAPQRANVHFVLLRTNAITTPNQPIRSEIVLHNYGQMDAVITTGCAQFADNGAKMPDKPSFPLCPKMLVIIPGGQDDTIFGDHTQNGGPVTRSQQWIDEVRAGKRPIYFYGRFSYHDAYSFFLNPLNVFGDAQVPYCVTYLPGDPVLPNCTSNSSG